MRLNIVCQQNNQPAGRVLASDWFGNSSTLVIYENVFLKFSQNFVSKERIEINFLNFRHHIFSHNHIRCSRAKRIIYHAKHSIVIGIHCTEKYIITLSGTVFLCNEMLDKYPNTTNKQ